MRRALLLASALLPTAAPASAQTVDRTQMARIIDEGTAHSEVMPIAEHLADVIGPRLTNSPAMRVAETWTQAKFAEWGLKNVHKEAFAFGRGWSIVSSSVRMVSPRPIQLVAIPIACLKGADMRQASVILAAFLVDAADADKALPRPPLPTKPVTTEPFAYAEDDD